MSRAGHRGWPRFSGLGGVLALGVVACAGGSNATCARGAPEASDAGAVPPSQIPASAPGIDGGGARARVAPGAVRPMPAKGGAATLAIPGRAESSIEVALPEPKRASPPLVIAFHSTGSEPSEAMDMAREATSLGAVVVAPRAGYRSGRHPADVDHDNDEGGSSWNMWQPDPAQNEDLRYVLSLIASAKAAYGVDTSRVYTMGFSNGGFMSYFVAASLPDVIAGFAESSAGWTTDACPTRYGDEARTGFLPTTGPGPGVAVTCSSLYASRSPPFPAACRPNAKNALRPPRLTGRVPFGYLAHYTSDDVVSVQWSCLLGEALGARAQVTIRRSDRDDVHGHSPPPDFVARAFAFFANRTSAE